MIFLFIYLFVFWNVGVIKFVQITATEKGFLVVLFIMLHKVVVTF